MIFRIINISLFSKREGSENTPALSPGFVRSLFRHVDIVDEPAGELVRSRFARETQLRGGRRTRDLQRIGIERIGCQSRYNRRRCAIDRSAANYLDNDLRQIAFLVLRFVRLAFRAIRAGFVSHRAEREVQVACRVQCRREPRPRFVLILRPLHGLRLDITDLSITRPLTDMGT